MAGIEANWVIVGLAVALLLLLGWFLRRAKRGRERFHAPDALDEGVAPARRNEAFIKAPSAAAAVDLGAVDLGAVDLGAVIATAAAQEAVIAVATGEATEAAAMAPAAPEAALGDDLSRIKGLGPKLKARLAELGVTRFAQIAAWSEADIAGIDAQLGSFAGRATRDRWVEQAGYLASGDVAGYEAQFGKL